MPTLYITLYHFTSYDILYHIMTCLDGRRVFKQKRKKNNLIMAAQGAGRRRFRGKAARWDFSETSPWPYEGLNDTR